jgi:hypothetical protein
MQYSTDPDRLVSHSFIVEAGPQESSQATLPRTILVGLPHLKNNNRASLFFPSTFKEQVHGERVGIANLWLIVKWRCIIYSNGLYLYF